MSSFYQYADAKVELGQIKAELDRFNAEIAAFRKEEQRLNRVFDAEEQNYDQYSQEMDELQPRGTNEQRFAQIDAVVAKNKERQRELVRRHGGSWSDLQDKHAEERRRLWGKRPRMVALNNRAQELEVIIQSYEGQMARDEAAKNAELYDLIDEIKGLARDL